MWIKIIRRWNHIFRSGTFLIGIEHFLVMFPSAMLIAKLCSSSYGAVVELSTILLACGVGTLIFVCIRKTPLFLGPSFVYIGFVSYRVSQIGNMQSVEDARTVIIWAYVIAGIMLLGLCAAFQSKRFRKAIALLFPGTVMGPAISLIGLELAGMAMQDAGFMGGTRNQKILALLTLGVIIVSALLRYHILQNASVLFGVLVGCIVALLLREGKLPTLSGRPVLHIPPLYLDSLQKLPPNIPGLVFAMLPPTVIAFAESLGRIAVYKGMLERDMNHEKIEKVTDGVLLFHSVQNLCTSVICASPSAIYAENLALMNLHNSELSQKQNVVEDEDEFINNCYSPYSIYPYVVASLLCIMVASIRDLQYLFMEIPISVFGGMELFIFGLIAAPGIQILVDQRVNYKKVANQVVTASVLMAGVSGLTVTVGTLTLQGMSLGLTVGVIVNLLVVLLRWLGILNERFSMNEILEECVRYYSVGGNAQIDFKVGGASFHVECTSDKWPAELQENISSISEVTIISSKNGKKAMIKQEEGRLLLELNIKKTLRNQFQNDHPNIMMAHMDSGNTLVIMTEAVSLKILREFLELAR